jgi:hypothetical protein
MMPDILANDILRYRGGINKNNLNEILKNLEHFDETVSYCSESPYIDVPNVSVHLKRHQNKFCILDLNVQSLNAKFDSLLLFLDELALNDFYFSAICLQETWLNEQSVANDLFNIPGYSAVTLPATCSSHGGLVIYLHDSFQFKKIDLYERSSIWEGIFIEINGDCLSRKITLGNIYRPPRDRNCDINSFLDIFSPIMAQLTNTNNDVIISGDFNIDLLKIESRAAYSDYLELMYSLSLIPTISLPTRLSRRSATLIDHIFYKSNQFKDVSGGIIVSNLSDHFMSFLCIDIKQSCQSRPKQITFQTSDEASIHNFVSAIYNVDFDSHIREDLETNPNHSYETFHLLINDCVETYLPIKSMKFNKYKHKAKPWITQGILHSLKHRDKMYKKLKTLPPNSRKYAVLKINLKTYTNITNKTIRQAKFDYFSNMFNKYKHDSKNSWKLINSLISSAKNKRDIVQFFIVNGVKESNEVEIANHFNDFFSSIGMTQASNIPQTQNSFAKYLSNRPVCTFSFRLTTPDDILNTIKSLKSKTSCGFDNLSVKLLKLVAPPLAVPLSRVINHSLNIGIFPDLLKIAKVVPLFKKDDKSVFSNYRPISLLPTFSKVFEKIAHKQLLEYFDAFKLFCVNQHGFRPDHSTNTATLEFIDYLFQLLDNDKIPFSIFMDLSKAFDTLDHCILLEKLSYYGIVGSSLNWFKSYLSDRKQYVTFNGSVSNTTDISIGVPQGSILGPLLFLIYINDLNNVSTSFQFLFYADDTTLTSTVCNFTTTEGASNTNIVNDELDKIFHWLCSNKLSLNIQKTKYMIFHPSSIKRRNVNFNNIRINGIPLENTNEFNFLGTIISSDLSWKPHTSFICKKNSRAIGILKRMRNMLPSYVLLSIYNSLIVPHLYYSVLVWGHSPGRVFKLQKRALRLVFKKKNFNDHTTGLFKDNGLLKFSDIYKSCSLKFYYKYRNNKLPDYFKDMFSPVPNTHDYNTRNPTRPQIPHKKYTSYCIRFMLPKLLTNTPPIILEKISTHSIDGFGKYFKQYTIKKYDPTCRINNCFVCRPQ